VRSIDQLDHILDRIADKAQTSTAIVKSQPIRRRAPGIGQRSQGGKATLGRVS
jgi:Lrp/AsnC family leucine-responsive transcriptional regulator